VLDIYELQLDNGRRMSRTSGTKGSIRNHLKEPEQRKAQDETRPTTRPSCGPSYMLLKGTRPTTRPSCRPSQGLLLELGPQLDRVVARVSAQKTPFRVLLHFTYLG